MFKSFACQWKGYTDLLNRDITDKATENFSGHLVAPDHELQPKSWFRATNRPLYVQKMLNS